MEGDAGGGAAGGVGVEAEKLDAPPLLADAAAAGAVEKVVGPPPLAAVAPVAAHLAVVGEHADQAAAAAAALARVVQVQRELGAGGQVADEIAHYQEDQQVLRDAGGQVADEIVHYHEKQQVLGDASQVAADQVFVDVGEEHQELEEPLLGQPAAAAAAAAARPAFYRDPMNLLLGLITITILAIILVANLGVHPNTWVSYIMGMTANDWKVDSFLAVGDITSLLLIYSSLPIFIGMWREGAAAGLARVVPCVASLLNCTVWFTYGVLVQPVSVSVIVVNATGVTFQVGYLTIYLIRSDMVKRLWVLLMVVLAAGVGVVAITAINLINHDMELSNAIGLSAACTSSTMYAMPSFVLLVQLFINGAEAAVPNVVMLFTTVLNASVWLAYGFLTDNANVKFPNCVGLLSCFIQAAVYLSCNLINSKKAARRTTNSTLEASLLEV